MTLSQALRRDTRTLHRAVEASGMMSALLRGQIDMPGYVALQRNLHAIYAALEPALQRQARHRSISPLGCARFCRLEPLTADLVELHGAAWALDIPLAPAASAYADHLQAIERQQPALLAAHAYVRYLGDLSGGQLLRGIVARSLGLADGVGTRFFDFGDAATVQALAASFRRGLDELDLAPVSEADVVHEAQHAFALHAQLFEELDAAQR